jgi:hypothetical protein
MYFETIGQSLLRIFSPMPMGEFKDLPQGQHFRENGGKPKAHISHQNPRQRPSSLWDLPGHPRAIALFPYVWSGLGVSESVRRVDLRLAPESIMPNFNSQE